MSGDEPLGHRLRQLAAEAEGVALPSGPSVRAWGDRRRRRRRWVAGTTVAVVAAGVVAAGALWSGVPSTVRPASKPPGGPGPARQTPAGADLAMLSTRLTRYVSTELARETTAGQGSPDNLWGPVTAEVSAPVRVGRAVVAVAAFSFDPSGRPVQVLSYAGGSWSPVATLPAPSSPGTVDHAGALDLVGNGTPIVRTDLTGRGRPSFLIPFAGAGCATAAVVFDAARSSGTGGRGWRYVSFTDSLPPSEVVGGNPRVVGRSLVTDNDCTAVPLPAAQRTTVTWTYASGAFTSVERPGWPTKP